MDDGFFPVEQRLIKGAKSSEGDVLLVDQGGSLGHDISEFHKKHPLAPGRLVLQDLPSVIAQAKDLDSKIEATGHDFFTEQPVKGESDCPRQIWYGPS